MNDCDSCKAYNESAARGSHLSCYLAEWYAPNAFRFCRQQVIWYFSPASLDELSIEDYRKMNASKVFANCDMLREGIYPPDPHASSAVSQGMGKYGKVKSHTAENIAAEIDVRQKRCGRDGKILEYELKLGVELSPSSYQALNYISGWRRRKESYRHFKSRGNNNKKGRTNGEIKKEA